MKKIKNKDRTSIIAILIIATITVVMIGGIFVLKNSLYNTNYTAEEMLHDHDGDGVPDH